jgi:hypothetical protein
MNHFMARLIFCFFAEAAELHSLFSRPVALMSKELSRTCLTVVIPARAERTSAPVLARS